MILQLTTPYTDPECPKTVLHEYCTLSRAWKQTGIKSRLHFETVNNLSMIG